MRDGRADSKKNDVSGDRELECGIFDIWVRLSCNSKFRGQFGRFDSSGANLSLV
jgi:hypothetical protein